MTRLPVDEATMHQSPLVMNPSAFSEFLDEIGSPWYYAASRPFAGLSRESKVHLRFPLVFAVLCGEGAITVRDEVNCHGLSSRFKVLPRA
jgi:hypothetical protein